MEEILLGYEAGTGEPVNIELKHAVFTGVTESGKTTAIETTIRQEIAQGKTGLVFLTKKGEEEFTEGEKIKPYFTSNPGRQQHLSEYVQELLEAYTGKSLGREETSIIKVVNGRYPNVDEAESVQEVRENINQLLELNGSEDSEISLHPVVENEFIKLAEYFKRTFEPIEEAELSDTLDLVEGELNIMDLRDFPTSLQSMIIERTLRKIYLDFKDVRVAIPEAWKFIPQQSSNICKDAVVQFIREGATNGNYLTIDAQDITRVDKETLKQMRRWVMGLQTEKNEVERTRDQVPAEKKNAPSKSEIMDLGVGFFWYCEATKGSGKARIQKVYVKPAWLDNVEWEGKTGNELAKAISMGEVDYQGFLEALDKGEIDTGKEKIEKEDNTVNDEDEEEEEIDGQAKKYKDRVENLEEKKKFLNKEIDELEKKLEDKDEEIQSLTERIESLEESSEDDSEESVKDIVAGEDNDEQPVEDSISQEEVEELKREVESLRQTIWNREQLVNLIDNHVENQNFVSKDWVNQKLSDMETGNTTRNLESVQDELLAQFQEETVDFLLDKVGGFTDKQLKMLLWIESRGKGVGSKKAWFQKSLNKDRNAGTNESEYMNELEEEGFVRVDDGGNIYPETKSLVEKRLDDSDKQTIEKTYNKLLAKMNEEIGENA